MPQALNPAYTSSTPQPLLSLLVLSVTLFLFYLAEINEEITQKSFLWGKIVISGSAASLFIFGKTGIFELFFFFSFSVFLLLLGIWQIKPEK